MTQLEGNFLFAFCLFGSMIQIVENTIHTSWVCVTLSMLFYYSIVIELDANLDPLTMLCNRRAYDSMIKDWKIVIKIGYCFRFGGDEYCILCEYCNEKKIRRVFSKLTEEINRRKISEDYFPDISYGYAIQGEKDVLTINQVIRLADSVCTYRSRIKRVEGECV